ncbi:MAG: helical backbone metal receptor [Thermoanaerobaculia bacterium]
MRRRIGFRDLGHPGQIAAIAGLAGLAGVAIIALVTVLAAGCESGHSPASAGGRIAVMAPGAAETLVELGVADRIVAVGDFVDWPPVLRTLPKLGAYDAPNPERLVELGVTLLFTTASEAGRGEHARLEKLGVHVVALETSTFAGTLAAIAETGRLVGRESPATELLARIQERLDAVRQRAATAPRRRVLIAVGRDPLFVAGPGSHLDELVTLAGGENVAHDSTSPYQMVALEAMLERAPEVIVDSADNRPGNPRGLVPGVWAKWPFLPAVQAGRVAFVDPWQLLVPGPRLAAMAELMGRLVHPEVFGEPRAEDFAGAPSL